jgi:sodium pump decarboxylase gamma subunit
MSESMFSLLFAITGMAAVFIVITILTIAMAASGNLLGRKPRGSTARGREKGAPARRGGTPEDHVAVIAAALAIHRGGSGGDVVLLADEEATWGTPARQGRGPGEVPALRRTR